MDHGVGLLDDPVARRLLASTNLVRLGYSWTDGSPRVVPTWFHFDGTALWVCTQPHAPKIRALSANPAAAATVDGSTFPYEVLLLRGAVTIDVLDDIAPEYVAAAERYLGVEAAPGWLAQLRGQPMARIRLTPTWATVLDFQNRFPSAFGA
jgi:hypothetical protein